MGNVVVRLTTDDHLIWGVVLCLLDNEGYRHTHTHTQYVSPVSFLGQQWVPQHISYSRYTYIVSVFIVALKSS